MEVWFEREEEGCVLNLILYVGVANFIHIHEPIHYLLYLGKS